MKTPIQLLIISLLLLLLFVPLYFGRASQQFHYNLDTYQDTIATDTLALLPDSSLTQGLIYGKVIAKDGTNYQGQLRWGDEAALWDDIFDAPKYELPVQNLLTPAEARRMERRTEKFKFGFMALWEDKLENKNFSFRCYFGDIISLESIENEVFLLTLKNSNNIKVKVGRYSDLTQNIRVYNKKVGYTELEFKNIQAIHFQTTPKNLHNRTGTPVYGKLLTTMGVFEGYVTWDLEERLGNDLINGRNRGIKTDILFKNIAELQTQGDGALLTLKSGKTIFLNDHDDVSAGNHGILVRNLSFGQLEIPWQNLIAATFFPASIPCRAYHDFELPQLLNGIIETKNGTTYLGQIIYDLDEIYNIEFLNGNNSDYRYSIPFQYVQTIVPQNDQFSIISLKDGQQYLLGNNPDVAGTSHGIVLKRTTEDAEYIPWNTIKNINFE